MHISYFADKEKRNDVNGTLLRAGLRPTRQRMILSELLFGKEHRHVSAEMLHREARLAGYDVSLATVYNTLHQFKQIGLLKEVAVEGGRSFFDTNMDDHHHFLCTESGRLSDIPHDHIVVSHLPQAPDGCETVSVEVFIRTRPLA